MERMRSCLLTAEIRGGRWKSAPVRVKCAGELGLSTRELAVQTEDCNIFLSGALLALHEAGRAVDANNQTSSDLGVESTGVTSALNAEHALEPGDDFVRGRVGGLVEVDDTGRNVGGQVAAERVATSGNRGEVTGADQELIPVLQKKRPVGVVDIGRDGLRLDDKLFILPDESHTE